MTILIRSDPYLENGSTSAKVHIQNRINEYPVSLVINVIDDIPTSSFCERFDVLRAISAQRKGIHSPRYT